MAEQINKFESWEEFNEFMLSATSYQLHELVLKHADCWVTFEWCEEDQMLMDETEDIGEIIYTRALSAPQVSSETLEYAAEEGSQSTWHRAYLSSILMESPAITTEILLKIPVDDYIDDVDTARQMFFHPLATIDVIKHVIEDYPEMINRLTSASSRATENEEEFVKKAQARWLEISETDRVPTKEEQVLLNEFLGIYED
jgi:hypothetical protein